VSPVPTRRKGRGLKKPAAASCDPGVRYWFEDVSKALLADTLVDMLRQEAGVETLDGLALLNRLRDAISTPARLRGDTIPPADGWEKMWAKHFANSNVSEERAAEVKATVLAVRPGAAGLFVRGAKAGKGARVSISTLQRILDSCPVDGCLSVDNVRELLNGADAPPGMAQEALDKLVTFGRFVQVGPHWPTAYRRVL
jgi:hypothetical protein